MRRSNNDVDEYLYEDEEEEKAYATLPGQYADSAPPAKCVATNGSCNAKIPTMVTG